MRGRARVSCPTGSAGGGGCAAPSRLRLHLRRAGGGGGGSSSRCALPPYLGETGWGRAGPRSRPGPNIVSSAGLGRGAAAGGGRR